MNDVVKLSALVFSRTMIGISKLTVTRWIIKNWFTSGELPLGNWYSWGFISQLNYQRIFGLIVIASFTLVTFPIGVWLASFEMSKSFPIINMIGSTMNFITFPINIFFMNKILVEMAINKTTMFGIIIIELSKILTFVGCYFLYIGN